jgi:PAT family beta-lactamase induction signal transducer AmpG
VGLAYAFKWVWSPLVDRLPLPVLNGWLGRRRSWLLLAQMLVVGGLLGMAFTDPQQDLSRWSGARWLWRFGSATQDIALDAYRIESADAERQAALAATYQTGYRLAMIWAGAGVLWLAAAALHGEQAAYVHAAWQLAYGVMAASMLVGMVTVLLSPEPAARAGTGAQPGRMAAGSAGGPVCRLHAPLRLAGVLILALIGLYRISDVVMGIMANPFYVDMGYTKDEVAAVTKVFGVIMTLLGAFVGGVMAMRWA